jgi:hypothetical protein
MIAILRSCICYRYLFGRTGLLDSCAELCISLHDHFVLCRLLSHPLSCCSPQVPSEFGAADPVSDDEVPIPCLRGPPSRRPSADAAATLFEDGDDEVHPILLWFHVMGMMRFALHILFVLVPSPLPIVRLQSAPQAHGHHLLGIVTFDVLLLLPCMPFRLALRFLMILFFYWFL